MGRSRWELASVVVVALVVLVGCDEWPQYLAGPAHTGHNAGEERVGRQNVRHLRVTWHVADVAVGSRSPAVTGGKAYAMEEVLDTATGARVDPGVVPGAGAAVIDDLVIGCRPSSSGADAVDRATGAVAWSVPDANCSGAGHTVADGLDYLPVFGPTPGRPELLAVDVATGAERWRRDPCPAGERYSSAPVTVAGGTAYVVCMGEPGVLDHSVAAVAAATGAPRWHAVLDVSSIGAVPSVVGDRVFVTGGGDGINGEEPPSAVFALDAGTGARLWRTGIPKRVGLSAPVTDGERLYVVDSDGVIRGIDAATGRVDWFNWTEPGTAAVANGVVYVAGFEGLVEAFDTGDGRRLVTLDLGDEVVPHAAPVVVGGTVFVTGRGLYALRAP